MNDASDDCDLKQLWISFYSDTLVLSVTVIVLLLSCIVSMYISLSVGLIISFSFAAGCALTIVLLNHKESVTRTFQKFSIHFGWTPHEIVESEDCDVCGVIKCNRHLTTPNREPWRGLFITRELDDALDSLYTKILNAFVESWFSLLSKNEDFVLSIKHCLREATCRLILKLKELNVSSILTNNLLPQMFDHHEKVQKMLDNGVPLNKLAHQFQLDENVIHPAVRSRQSELDYLRAVAKCLLPRICNNQNLDSKVLFSLGRELLACWVLLPMMDVLAEPNWLNAMIIAATNKSMPATAKPMTRAAEEEKVMFLSNFVEKGNRRAASDDEQPIDGDMDFLQDQHQLYMFMQFLKREGAVDILRFYLDVDNLNSELMDPKVTTDPAKLSALQQQSEILLQAYQAMMRRDFKQPVKTLVEAQEDVKRCLQGKWRRAFHLTPEYFRLIYGNRQIKELPDSRNNLDAPTGTVSRIGSKLKGAIRGAIDGAPLEATEVPTVWDAFTDDSQVVSSNTQGNSTIYNSVAQKLRKERGQNLDAFIHTFMQSIEQSSNTDIGEDVIMMKEIQSEQHRPRPPGCNPIFGNLFGLMPATAHHNHASFGVRQHTANGPSECFIYILSKILDVPTLIVRFILGWINISKSMVDFLLCKGIDKLIAIALYEPRLTAVIKTVEEQLFGAKEPDPSPTELLERQRQAKKRLAKISNKLSKVADTLQSATLNKHLVYCLFDSIVAELYPELENVLAKE